MADQPPQMKMTTKVPPGIAAPDEVETRLGTLRYTDGVPDAATTQKVFEQLDFQRGVEAMLMTLNGASMWAFRHALRTFGPDNQTAIIWEQRMDSKVLLLTPNTTVVYCFAWLDTSEGPVVLEYPPSTLGIIDSFWFNYVGDLGPAGPDKGEGGKYLLLPPGYDGDLPDGYHIMRSETYGNWLVARGFLVDGDAGPAVSNIKENLRIYPLADREKRPAMNMVDVSGEDFNTIHTTDFSFYEEINDIVQEEPASAQVPEILGMLASIGIEKGKPFDPDARMKQTLIEAAAVGTAAARSILYRSRDDFAAYPDSGWEEGFPAGSYQFLQDGVRMNDQRVRFFFFATGVTPAMIQKMIGVGSQYMMGVRDAAGHHFDGSKTYRLNIPTDVPAKQFWDVTIYDLQTRSLLQTDQEYPGIASTNEDLQRNADGSWDLYFGPEMPAGQEGNWLQTIPGKGWHSLFRLYAPLEPWFDKTWRPGEVELIG